MCFLLLNILMFIYNSWKLRDQGKSSIEKWVKDLFKKEVISTRLNEHMRMYKPPDSSIKKPPKVLHQTTSKQREYIIQEIYHEEDYKKKKKLIENLRSCKSDKTIDAWVRELRKKNIIEESLFAHLDKAMAETND